ncbi:MAG TPA: chemotaxis protein CheB [Thermoanaerobaculia bacterium]|nr:chemotaxis protein CheB [Thermoanaerobaculia bacterium]
MNPLEGAIDAAEHRERPEWISGERAERASEPSALLVLGASAGGVQALCEVVQALPARLDAAVFAVLHVSPYGRSAMPAILSRSGPLTAVHPADGEAIRAGRIYVAPPDLHMLVERGLVRLSRAASENGFRPSVDVLFRSAARSYGARVVAVVLTGNLDDGTAGLAAVKRHGGVAVVQDPAEADYPGMPASAVRNVDVDYVLPLGEIPGVLVDLCDRLAAEAAPPAAEDEAAGSAGATAGAGATSSTGAGGDPGAAGAAADPGHAGGDGGAAVMKEQLEHGADREAGARPSGFTCPLCGGSLWHNEEGSHEHFRCRTGHAFSPESLFALQSKSTETALWEALRALEENAALSGRLARQIRGGLHAADQERFRMRQRAAELHAEELRRILMRPDGLSGGA